MEPSEPKPKRKSKNKGLSQLLVRISAAAAELSRTAERAEQMLRQDKFRTKKNKDRLRIVLQQELGVMDMLKRVMVRPENRDVLVQEGFIREKKKPEQ